MMDSRFSFEQAVAFHGHSRSTGRAVRVRSIAGPGKFDGSREERIKWILSAPLNEVVEVEMVQAHIPPRAMLRDSGVCQGCGESVMVSRLVSLGGGNFCIPCSERNAL